MGDTLWRLTWALPLVLGVGVLAMFALKRIMSAGSRASGSARGLVLQESLKLSDQATAHWISVDGRPMLVVEAPGALSSIELTTAARRPTWPSGWAMRGRTP